MIKFLTCQRKISSQYGRGFIEQAFRRLTLTWRSARIHGEENAPFLQRKDALLLGHGRGYGGHSRIEGPAHSVRVKVEQELSNA